MTGCQNSTLCHLRFRKLSVVDKSHIGVEVGDEARQDAGHHVQARSRTQLEVALLTLKVSVVVTPGGNDSGSVTVATTATPWSTLQTEFTPGLLQEGVCKPLREFVAVREIDEDSRAGVVAAWGNERDLAEDCVDGCRGTFCRKTVGLFVLALDTATG